jgi:hypothetical protein
MSSNNIFNLLIASELWSQQADESLGCGKDFLLSPCSSFGIPFMSSNNKFLPADSW